MKMLFILDKGKGRDRITCNKAEYSDKKYENK